MAPEEFEHGAMIDERTTVFHLGRTAGHLLGASNLSGAQKNVIEAATRSDRDRRYPDVETMATAWRSANVS